MSQAPSGSSTPPSSQAQHDYWSKTLADAPTLDLPTDQPRSSQQSFNESQLSIRLDAPLTQSLRSLALNHDADLGTVIVAGWTAVLSRLSGQEDIIIGFSTDGSDQPESNRHLDYSALPLRVDLSGEPNTTQLLERVQKMNSAAMAHRGPPSHQIIDIINSSKGEGFPPLFQVAFQWCGEGWCSREQETDQVLSTPLVDIELHLRELDNEIAGQIRFSTALFKVDTIKRHAGYLEVMLRAMVGDQTRPIAMIDIISPAERELILETWNETSEVYPDHLCSHQLFEQQADKSPNSIAVACEDQVLSYGELNAFANRLSHRLIDLGVRLETRVAICMERSPGMIAGILAIMKAGGAYLPLDPQYATERLRNMLADAEPTIVVADTAGKVALGEAALSSMKVVDPNALQDYPASNPQ
ncbi:hypothetical protein BGZ65_008001, partial [Modicella reniformis]